MNLFLRFQFLQSRGCSRDEADFLVELKPIINPRLKSTGITVIVLFVMTLGIYWLSAMVAGHNQSPEYAYFHDLADAFLHGRLYLLHPLATRDLTQFNGYWYVPFPPLPAILLLPWVAVSGVTQVNTVLFAAVMGAINVALAFLLLQALARRGWTQLSLSDNVWLTILWGVGSVQWYMSTQGTVWFVSQICTVTFMLLAAWLVVSKRSPLLAGCALALAVLGRPNVALFYPFLAGVGLELIQAEQKTRNFRRWLRWCMLALAPLIVSALLLLGYNYARFQNIWDFGYAHADAAPQVAGDLTLYGQFNLCYVPHNLWAMLLSGPTWESRSQTISPNPEGMSLLLTTPALIYLLRVRKRSPLVIGAWVAVTMLMLPLVTYYNTGWVQFGYRFSLDFMTPLLVLLAVGASQRTDRLLRCLILGGVLINAWGVWWFNTYSSMPQPPPF